MDQPGISRIWLVIGILAVVLAAAGGWYAYQTTRTTVEPTASTSPSASATSTALVFASKDYGFKVALAKATWDGYETYASQLESSGGAVTRVGFFLPYTATGANSSYKAEVPGYAEVFHVIVMKKSYYATLSAEDKKVVDAKTLLTNKDNVYTYYYTGQTLPTFAKPFTTAKDETEKVLKTFASHS